MQGHGGPSRDPARTRARRPAGAGPAAVEQATGPGIADPTAGGVHCNRRRPPGRVLAARFRPRPGQDLRAARRNAAAAVLEAGRRGVRPRALPDRVCERSRGCGRADRGPAFRRCDARGLPAGRHGECASHAARRGRHVPVGTCRRSTRSPDACGTGRGPAGDLRRGRRVPLARRSRDRGRHDGGACARISGPGAGAPGSVRRGYATLHHAR